MQATQRTFKDVETGYNFRLYTSQDASKYHLISEGQHDKMADGCEVNGFYLSAHTPTDVKVNGSKIVKLDRGEFYNLKEGERVTHRKFCGFSKFTKI